VENLDMLDKLNNLQGLADEEYNRRVEEQVNKAMGLYWQRMTQLMPGVDQQAGYGGGGGEPTAETTGNPKLDYSGLKKTLQQGHVEIKVPKQEESSQKESDKHPNTKKEKSSSQNKREKAIKKYLQDNTAVFNSLASQLQNPFTSHKYKQRFNDLVNTPGYSIYAGKIIPNNLYPYIQAGFNRGINQHPVETAGFNNLTPEQIEAIKAGYNVANGKYPWDGDFKEIDKYQKAPVQNENGDFVTSTGIFVPEIYVRTIKKWESDPLFGDKKDLYLDGPKNFRNPESNESMTIYGIKPGTVDDLINRGYFLNLKNASRQEKLKYIQDNPEATVAEILGAYIDITMSSLYPEGYSIDDVHKNFGLIATYYNQNLSEERWKGDFRNLMLEDNGYGIIAHNILWYDMLGKKPQYSGKFQMCTEEKDKNGIIVKKIFPAEKKANWKPRWEDKTKYFLKKYF
jgi:hypothetical protein